MYKRQHYAAEHADNGDASSSSSSSLDTDSDGAAEENDAQWPASSHESSEEEAGEEEGYEGEKASSDEGEHLEVESEDEEWGAYRSSRTKEVQTLDSRKFLSNQWAEAVEEAEKEHGEETIGDSMVLQVGGVFKCRLCVKTMCLSEESMKAHLLSRGHARSLKQLASGKLKVQLDSEGEEEEEAETHTERLARIRALAEMKIVEPTKRKRDSGRQRQRKRAKKKALLAAKTGTAQETLKAAPEIGTDSKTPKTKTSKTAIGQGKVSSKAPTTPSMVAPVGTAKVTPKRSTFEDGSKNLDFVGKKPKFSREMSLSVDKGNRKWPLVRRKDKVRKRKSL